MINYKDYSQYISENKKIINILNDNGSIIYDRIDDAISALDIISDYAKKSNKLEEEIETIFEVGFTYIHEQLELIKIYFYDYFKGDYLLFKQFEKAIYYILFIDDLCEVLDEMEYLTDERRDYFENISREIEERIQSRKEFDIPYFENLEIGISSHLPRKAEIYTTEMIFADIREELEKPLIIGEDD